MEALSKFQISLYFTQADGVLKRLLDTSFAKAPEEHFLCYFENDYLAFLNTHGHRGWGDTRSNVIKMKSMESISITDVQS